MKCPGIAPGLESCSLAHAHSNLDIMFLSFALSVPMSEPCLSASVEKSSSLLLPVLAPATAVKENIIAEGCNESCVHCLTSELQVRLRLVFMLREAWWPGLRYLE